MPKVNKNCSVRLPVALHHEAKLTAYKDGKTLQDYIIALIDKDLKLREETAPDGGWRHVIREAYKE